MKTASKFNFIITVLIFVFCIPNLQAMDVNVLQSDLGISLYGNYSNADLSNAAPGMLMRGIIVDPSKIGGCLQGDKVELMNIGEGVWQIKHFESGQVVSINILNENGNLSAKKVRNSHFFDQGISSKLNNVMIKLGAYVPDNDTEDIDTGFYNQISYNRYLNKNFAIEIGGGSFFTSGKVISRDYSNREITISGDLYGYNLIFNLKAIIPFSNGEIYAGIGPSIYYLVGDEDKTSTVDSDIVIGGQIVAGLNFNVTDIVFLGLEGQYIFTEDAHFSDVYSLEASIDGYNISGVIGFRF